MMLMKNHRIHKKLLVNVASLVLLVLIGCKSPIDLNHDVKEVPIQTALVDMSDLSFSVGGGGISMRYVPNTPPEDSRFSFRSLKLDKIHIDTTNKQILTIAMKYSILTDVGDSSRYEEVLPVSIYHELDTINVPIFDIPPGQRDKIPFMMNVAKLKAYIFSKRKDGTNGFRMIRSEKEFDLLEDSGGYNHADSYVYAIRSRASQGKHGVTIFIESGFSLNTVEIESFDKKFRSNSSGRSILKISF